MPKERKPIRVVLGPGVHDAKVYLGDVDLCAEQYVRRVGFNLVNEELPVLTLELELVNAKIEAAWKLPMEPEQ